MFYILLLAREKYNMAVFSFTALLFIALTVKWTEGGNSHILIKSINSPSLVKRIALSIDG